MKKILFLLLICFIKLNAYDFIFYSYNNNNNQRFFKGDDGRLYIYYINNGVSTSPVLQNDNINTIWDQLNFIKQRTGNYTGDWSGNFITIYKMKKYFEEDNNFINDLYLNCTQAILNYFYNSSSFSKNNHIKYENYELLYNSDGLAVESIVNEKWAGLYSESEKSSSGSLYDSGGTLIYYNGEKVNWMQSTIDKLIRNVINNLYELVHIISTPVGVCVSVVFSLCLVYYVVEVGRRAIKPIDDNIRKRNLNE